jgi:hypothetical protein
MKAACASWPWPGSHGRPCPPSLWPLPLLAFWLASVPHKLQQTRELSRSAQRDLQLHRSDDQYYPEGVYDSTWVEYCMGLERTIGVGVRALEPPFRAPVLLVGALARRCTSIRRYAKTNSLCNRRGFIAAD